MSKKLGHGGGPFDLVAKIAGLPSSYQLRRYTISNSNDPDGIMHDNCDRAKEIFDQKFPNAGMFDFIRHVCLAFHSMHVKDFKPMIELFNSVDRLVDIMNGTGFKKGKDRNVELINKPKHRHVLELFDILRLFEEWKTECGGYTDKFITQYTYEDLVWMVFGVAGVAIYLKEDGSIAMHQGRHGSDVLEHLFSQIRYINCNPNMVQARECLSNVTSTNNMHTSAFLNKSKGNSGTAPSEITAKDLMAPIHAKKQRCKRD